MLFRPNILRPSEKILPNNAGVALIPLRELQRAFRVNSYDLTQSHYATSASSSRWKTRQAQDHFAREARVQGLKSRAAFKLLQINEKYKIFKKGTTVVDLGFAPGSWSQVAVNRTAPGGRVVGVDILPAQPPRGVSTIQGNFLSPDIQAEVRAYVQDPAKGRPIQRAVNQAPEEDLNDEKTENSVSSVPSDISYISMQMNASEEHGVQSEQEEQANPPTQNLEHMNRAQRDEKRGWVVDVVLSDMSEPWEQTTGFGKRSISDPYYRLMNTSGIPFRDHAGSMDLCTAALTFCYDTLRTGGHFVCKFYQGAEDKQLENTLKRLFEKVHRDKPSASRSESREGYFIGLRRKEAPSKEDIFRS